jgi:hypothetical protein
VLAVSVIVVPVVEVTGLNVAVTPGGIPIARKLTGYVKAGEYGITVSSDDSVLP